MHPIHRTAVAAILGLAVIAGLLGLSRTLDLGAATAKSHPTDTAALARRSHALDRVQASLKKALAQRPPALPAVPTYSAPAAAPAAAAARPAGRQVTYVRPPPRVVTIHRAGGEHEGHDGGTGHQDD